MKNSIKKLNIFAFVLVFSFSGLFANVSFAQSNGGATYWNGEELVPIDWDGSSIDNDDDNDDDNNNNDDQVTTLSATSIDEDSARLRGEVTNGSNVDVWFVIDDNDSTPSCSDDDLEYTVSGDFDDGDEFSRTVSGLYEDETYYFRACTNDDSGSVRSFTTDDNNSNDNDNDNNDNDNDSSSDDLVALTSYATGVTTNSAFLNGVSIINNGGNGNAWFEYGITTAMGNRTPNQSIGNGTSNISRQILGLSQKTNYYFRLVIQNNEGTDYGDIATFKTGGVSVVTTTNTGSVAGATTSNTANSSVFLSLDLSSNLEKVSIGDTVTYTVSYKNNSGKDLKNVIMQVNLPKETAFRKTTLGGYSKSTNSVVVTVETLPKEAKGEFFVIVDVLKSAQGETLLIASLLGIHDHPTTLGAKVDSLVYSIIEVVSGGSNQSANSIFAGKFFPTSFVGWLLIILIIFFIVLIARKLARDKEEKEEQKKSEEGIKIAK
jgi:uncharacterized repeat protein (TIGR01451 family)